ncbi:MAG: ATP-binding protein [Planctomycetes bacterium]|nr:ATP-binding protein [Planctomycetota bacterium]
MSMGLGYAESQVALRGRLFKTGITVSSQPASLSLVRDFIGRVTERLQMPRGEAGQCVLAVDEAVANIMEHGYGGVSDAPIEIDVEADSACLRIVVRDEADTFDPLIVPDPDLPRHVAMGRNRGLGLFLMRRMMDEVHYRAGEPIGNELTLIKRFHRPVRCAF